MKRGTKIGLGFVGGSLAGVAVSTGSMYYYPNESRLSDNAKTAVALRSELDDEKNAFEILDDVRRYTAKGEQYNELVSDNDVEGQISRYDDERRWSNIAGFSVVGFGCLGILSLGVWADQVHEEDMLRRKRNTNF